MWGLELPLLTRPQNAELPCRVGASPHSVHRFSFLALKGCVITVEMREETQMSLDSAQTLFPFLHILLSLS